jgi:hypothetical protein
MNPRKKRKVSRPLAVADAVNAGISLAFLGLFPNSAN